MRARIVGACYLAWLAALTAVSYAWPGTRPFTWGAIGLTSTVAVLAGVRVYRPARRLPWLLLAAAILCFAIGDTTYHTMDVFGPEPPFPSTADVFHLAVYPLLGASLSLFIRARSGEANRAALLDALVPTVGLGLVSWVFLIAPYTRDDSLTVLQKIVSVGHPLGDVLALAMLLRLLAIPGRKPAAVSLLSLGIVGVLVSDVTHGLARLDSAWAAGGPMELGWVAFYAALGMAAMVPSMRTLSVPVGAEQPHAEPAGGRRLVFMTLASLIAPVMLYQEYLQGAIPDAPIIAAAAALMFLLVLARVGGLITEQRQASARERALRETSETLASAATAADIGRALRAATAKLMPPGEPYDLITSERPADDTGDAPRLALVPSGELPHGVPVHGFDLVLHAVVPLPGSSRQVGVAVLAAPAATLRRLMPAFEALFAQIAVVLERVRLTGEISRRDSEAYFRTLIQSASDVILIVGDDDRIRYASPSAETVFGRADLAGAALAGLIADTHHDALRDLLTGVRIGGHLDEMDLTAVCADRRLLQVACSARDLRADPTVRGIVLTVRDVTERRRLENDLAHQAFHDSLTGLANRVLFRNRLEHAFTLAERSGTTIGVLFVDLDDFKEVNDTLGHAVGDQLLVAVGQRIAHAIGTGDTAARMGGDEFAILIEQGFDSAAAETVADRIVSALSAPVDVSDGMGGMYVVSGAASVGVATSRDADRATELLRHADLALYLAKEAGKGTWQSYRNDLHTAMVERLEMRTALHEAVDGEQFALQFQPIVDLASGRIAGVESLVRWQHPTRGLLGPNHFIELAEENGAIVGIGAWVLRESLRQLAEWHAAVPDNALRYISVNVSARQFRTPGFVDQVRTALAETGSDPGRLVLEITESLVLRDAEPVWADLAALRELGVRIAIDDFGTGYSSLSYLRQMPVSVLKIDKSFIDDILGSGQQRALVNAIVTLARNLDLSVVAEGIEDAAQRALLSRMGCPYGQGYLFSKPVWPADVLEWLSGSHVDGAGILTG
ncbi:MAG TPA: EAL domain-containing protein [Actinoplanes sp.]|nr:EAL domain-containing protein [Actinoplanes sp.]